MIQFKMTLEDTLLTATFRQSDDDEMSQVVDIEVTDSLSGVSGNATWTTEQWRAVHLLIANDDSSLPNTKELYAIAEPAIAMIPSECRPIP